jgi:hypothetical protein
LRYPILNCRELSIQRNEFFLNERAVEVKRLNPSLQCGRCGGKIQGAEGKHSRGFVECRVCLGTFEFSVEDHGDSVIYIPLHLAFVIAGTEYTIHMLLTAVGLLEYRNVVVEPLVEVLGMPDI